MWDYTRFATGDADLGRTLAARRPIISIFSRDILPSMSCPKFRICRFAWRRWVGTTGRQPTPSSTSMRELVQEWLDAGAVAFNTGLDYQPTAFADTRELIELSKVTADAGAIYAAHIRYNILGREAAWRETFEISRRSRNSDSYFARECG